MMSPTGVHYVSSDGAPSHFKNRFTICFLLQLLLLGRTVIWGFQAPSHGKGPWDGLAAVIKTLLRRMELHPKFPGYRHCKVWWNIFMFLSHHYGKKKKHNDEDLSLDDNDSWFGKCPDPLQDGLVDSLYVHYIRTSEKFNDVREDWSEMEALVKPTSKHYHLDMMFSITSIGNHRQRTFYPSPGSRQTTSVSVPVARHTCG